MTKDCKIHIDESVLYILGDGKSSLNGCLAVQFDRNGRIGQTRALDSILGYSEITDGTTIYKFFDEFATNRANKIKEDENSKQNELKQSLAPFIKEIVESYLSKNK